MNRTSQTPPLNMLLGLARRIRRHSLISTTKAGSGHPTTCLSAADLVTALFFTQLRYDFDNPGRPDNDRFILSKGHAAPVLYGAWAAAGVVKAEQVDSLRELTSDFEGHPTPRLPWVDVATGSLGQGLGNGVGMALYLRDIAKTSARVFVLLGDGELAEGSNWEVAPIAGQKGLGNLVALIDLNRLGQSSFTRYGWEAERYAAPLRTMGWQTLEIDGHDMAACVEALAQAEATTDRPVAILARTKKGQGVSFLADKENWHGKPVPQSQLAQALSELADPPSEPEAQGVIRKPEGPLLQRPAKPQGSLHDRAASLLALPTYPPSQPIATRRAFGEALQRLGQVDPQVVVFDADVKNSTYTEIFEKAYPERFVQSFIAEQAMVGMAAGAGAIGATPWCATFAAFLTRAYDQVRMAALSSSNLKVCGSHAGTSIGEDGASQMGLEDLAMFRAVCGSVVVYPADPYATEYLVRELSQIHGVSYLRATRAATKVLYGPQDRFPLGGSKILRQGDNDACLVVAAGITLHEALVAHEILAKEGIAIRLMDAYSVKPIDQKGLIEHGRACRGRILVVEDHWPEGGLGDAVLSALAEEPAMLVKKVAVQVLPRSGKPEELLDLYGLSGAKIAATVRAWIGSKAS